MADFETSTEEWLVKDNGVARVWAGCLATIEKEPKVIAITNNIDDLLNGVYDKVYKNMMYK